MKPEIPSRIWTSFRDAGRKGKLPRLQKLCDQHLAEYPSVIGHALDAAASYDQFELVRYIVENHGVAIPAEMVHNALSLALVEEREEMATILIPCEGIDLDQPIGMFGSSPLMVAVYRGLEQVVACLLKNGVTIDYQAELPFEDPTNMFGGDTALITAVQRNHVGMVKTLLSHDANVNPIGQKGKTALDHAGRSAKRKAVRELLLGHGAQTGKELRGADESKRKKSRRKSKD